MSIYAKKRTPMSSAKEVSLPLNMAKAPLDQWFKRAKLLIRISSGQVDQKTPTLLNSNRLCTNKLPLSFLLFAYVHLPAHHFQTHYFHNQINNFPNFV